MHLLGFLEYSNLLELFAFDLLDFFASISWSRSKASFRFSFSIHQQQRRARGLARKDNGMNCEIISFGPSHTSIGSSKVLKIERRHKCWDRKLATMNALNYLY